MRIPLVTSILLISFIALRARAEELNLAPPAPLPTSLTYYSTPGELLGRGETHTYTPADGAFASSANPNAVSISFNWSHLPYWFAEFRGPDDQPLGVGLYEHAQRNAFASPGHPGLDFHGNHLGWNTIAGEFRIFQIEFNPNGTLARFAADFVQRGDGLPQPLYGRVRYNATVPEPGAIAILLPGVLTLLIRRKSRSRRASWLT